MAEDKPEDFKKEFNTRVEALLKVPDIRNKLKENFPLKEGSSFPKDFNDKNFPSALKTEYNKRIKDLNKDDKTNATLDQLIEELKLDIETGVATSTKEKDIRKPCPVIIVDERNAPDIFKKVRANKSADVFKLLRDAQAKNASPSLPELFLKKIFVVKPHSSKGGANGIGEFYRNELSKKITKFIDSQLGRENKWYPANFQQELMKKAINVLGYNALSETKEEYLDVAFPSKSEETPYKYKVDLQDVYEQSKRVRIQITVQFNSAGIPTTSVSFDLKEPIKGGATIKSKTYSFEFLLVEPPSQAVYNTCKTKLKDLVQNRETLTLNNEDIYGFLEENPNIQPRTLELCLKRLKYNKSGEFKDLEYPELIQRRVAPNQMCQAVVRTWLDKDVKKKDSITQEEINNVLSKGVTQPQLFDCISYFIVHLKENIKIQPLKGRCDDVKTWANSLPDKENITEEQYSEIRKKVPRNDLSYCLSRVMADGDLPMTTPVPKVNPFYEQDVPIEPEVNPFTAEDTPLEPEVNPFIAEDVPYTGPPIEKDEQPNYMCRIIRKWLDTTVENKESITKKEVKELLEKEGILEQEFYGCIRYFQSKGEKIVFKDFLIPIKPAPVPPAGPLRVQQTISRTTPRSDKEQRFVEFEEPLPKAEDPNTKCSLVEKWLEPIPPNPNTGVKTVTQKEINEILGRKDANGKLLISDNELIDCIFHFSIKTDGKIKLDKTIPTPPNNSCEPTMRQWLSGLPNKTKIKNTEIVAYIISKNVRFKDFVECLKYFQLRGEDVDVEDQEVFNPFYTESRLLMKTNTTLPKGPYLAPGSDSIPTQGPYLAPGSESIPQEPTPTQYFAPGSESIPVQPSEESSVPTPVSTPSTTEEPVPTPVSTSSTTEEPVPTPVSTSSTTEQPPSVTEPTTQPPAESTPAPEPAPAPAPAPISAEPDTREFRTGKYFEKIYVGDFVECETVKDGKIVKSQKGIVDSFSGDDATIIYKGNAFEYSVKQCKVIESPPKECILNVAKWLETVKDRKKITDEERSEILKQVTRSQLKYCLSYFSAHGEEVEEPAPSPAPTSSTCTKVEEQLQVVFKGTKIMTVLGIKKILETLNISYEEFLQCVEQLNSKTPETPYQYRTVQDSPFAVNVLQYAVICSNAPIVRALARASKIASLQSFNSEKPSEDYQIVTDDTGKTLLELAQEYRTEKTAERTAVIRVIEIIEKAITDANEDLDNDKLLNEKYTTKGDEKDKEFAKFVYREEYLFAQGRATRPKTDDEIRGDEDGSKAAARRSEYDIDSKTKTDLQIRLYNQAYDLAYAKYLGQMDSSKNAPKRVINLLNFSKFSEDRKKELQEAYDNAYTTIETKGRHDGFVGAYKAAFSRSFLGLSPELSQKINIKMVNKSILDDYQKGYLYGLCYLKAHLDEYKQIAKNAGITDGRNKNTKYVTRGEITIPKGDDVDGKEYANCPADPPASSDIKKGIEATKQAFSALNKEIRDRIESRDSTESNLSGGAKGDVHIFYIDFENLDESHRAVQHIKQAYTEGYEEGTKQAYAISQLRGGTRKNKSGLRRTKKVSKK